MRIAESKDRKKETGFLGFQFFLMFSILVCNEKKGNEKRKDVEKESRINNNLVCASKLCGQLARLSIVELKDGLSAGFLVFSIFLVFQFYVGNVRSGVLILVP